MTLTGVTLTGADDTVDPSELVRLSEKYPRVEWGILVGSRVRSRFPSPQWINELAAEQTQSFPVNLSLHICGPVLGKMMGQGLFSVELPFYQAAWRRSQLNFHGQPITQEQADGVVAAMLHDWIADEEIIVQLDGENDWVLDRLLAQKFRASGLYDRSHGAGVSPGKWPTPNPKWEIGYAGGLGPDNLHRELRAIAEAAGGQRFWIDMETKLRSDEDKFDLDKCRCVLEEVFGV